MKKIQENKIEIYDRLRNPHILIMYHDMYLYYELIELRPSNHYTNKVIKNSL